MTSRTPDKGAPSLPDPDVIAAGAVVFHDDAVLLVHRPRYDDWAFPKGKQDPGEHEAVTAVREVLEETGVEIRLGRPLPSRAYLIGGNDPNDSGRTKIVHYWCASVVGDPDVWSYLANAEIDGVAWVPIDKATDRLTYQLDREVLADALADPEPTTPLVILRHAKAASRKHFRGTDDRDRELTNLGHQQARRLVPLLAAYALTHVVTSSSTRCNDTVLPYAHEYVLGVHATPKLSEESAAAEPLGKFLRKVFKRGESTLLCTHRPVLPTLLEALGVPPVDDDPLKPAEMLVIHHRAGLPVGLERHLAG